MNFIAQTETKLIRVANTTARLYEFNFTNRVNLTAGTPYYICAWNDREVQLSYYSGVGVIARAKASTWATNYPSTISGYGSSTTTVYSVMCYYVPTITTYSNENPYMGQSDCYFNSTDGLHVNTSVQYNSNTFPKRVRFFGNTNASGYNVTGASPPYWKCLSSDDEPGFRNACNGTGRMNCTPGLGQNWFYFDMGVPITVIGAKGRSNTTGDSESVIIKSSIDGVTFTTRGTYTDWQDTSVWVTHYFSTPVVAQYWMFRESNTATHEGQVYWALGNSSYEPPFQVFDLILANGPWINYMNWTINNNRTIWGQWNGSYAGVVNWYCIDNSSNASYLQSGDNPFWSFSLASAVSFIPSVPGRWSGSLLLALGSLCVIPFLFIWRRRRKVKEKQW